MCAHYIDGYRRKNKMLAKCLRQKCSYEAKCSTLTDIDNGGADLPGNTLDMYIVYD